MALQRTIKAHVRNGEKLCLAECVQIAVVTQGKTLDEMLVNLQEAVALHLEDEDPADYGLVRDPAILVTIELEPAGAQA